MEKKEGAPGAKKSYMAPDGVSVGKGGEEDKAGCKHGNQIEGDCTTGGHPEGNMADCRNGAYADDVNSSCKNGTKPYIT